MNTNQHGEGRIESLSTLGELMSKGFEHFWQAWPSSPRKGAKSSCKAKWDKQGFDLQADQIIKHVEWLKTTEQWKKGNGSFIPAPLVYLNQMRWDGAEVPEPPPPPKSYAAILRSPFSCLSKPKAKAAAVGSLMMRLTSKPAIRPASLVA